MLLAATSKKRPRIASGDWSEEPATNGSTEHRYAVREAYRSFCAKLLHDFLILTFTPCQTASEARSKLAPAAGRKWRTSLAFSQRSEKK